MRPVHEEALADAAARAKGTRKEDSMTIIPFSYGDRPVRVIERADDPWWVAKDVCDILGLVNIGNVLAALDDDEKDSIHIADGNRGNPNKAIVSEAGLYSLILRSRKPEARAFKRWVTHEVLPQVRRRGAYLTPEAAEQALTDPDFIIRLATDLKAERARRAELEARAEADRPKVLFADSVAASHSTVLVGELAKILRGNGVQVGQNRLFEVLRRRGYLISREGSDRNMPTQRAMELGLFEIRETAITHSDGHVTVSKTPKITGRGQQYFIERFLDGRLTPSLDDEEAAA